MHLVKKIGFTDKWKHMDDQRIRALRSHRLARPRLLAAPPALRDRQPHGQRLLAAVVYHDVSVARILLQGQQRLVRNLLGVHDVST